MINTAFACMVQWRCCAVDTQPDLVWFSGEAWKGYCASNLTTAVDGRRSVMRLCHLDTKSLHVVHICLPVQNSRLCNEYAYNGSIRNDTTVDAGVCVPTMLRAFFLSRRQLHAQK